MSATRARIDTLDLPQAKKQLLSVYATDSHIRGMVQSFDDDTLLTELLSAWIDEKLATPGFRADAESRIANERYLEKNATLFKQLASENAAEADDILSPNEPSVFEASAPPLAAEAALSLVSAAAASHESHNRSAVPVAQVALQPMSPTSYAAPPTESDADVLPAQKGSQTGAKPPPSPRNAKGKAHDSKPPTVVAPASLPSAFSPKKDSKGIGGEGGGGDDNESPVEDSAVEANRTPSAQSSAPPSGIKPISSPSTARRTPSTGTRARGTVPGGRGARSGSKGPGAEGGRGPAAARRPREGAAGGGVHAARAGRGRP